ncbi:MAG TPA: hypothetical protein VID74_05760 [Gemmatimonadales bacterium]|jgi:hypothetical protein
MTEPRDWDKEMAEIDKIIASGKAPPPAPVPQALPAGAPPRSSAPVAIAPGPVQTRGRDKVGVWLRTLLGAAGAVALPFWPYGKTCGAMLYLYLLGTLGVIAAGIWAMRGAWTHRRGVAHIGGLLVLLAGLGFAAIEIVHRTGFAAGRLGWICP